MQSIIKILGLAVLCQFFFTMEVQAAKFSSSRHGFVLNVKKWSTDRQGEERNYYFGQATNPGGLFRFWFILSQVNQKETDGEWVKRQLVAKSVPQFAKKHDGHCDVEEKSMKNVSIGAITGTQHDVRLSCDDGHATQAAYVAFRSPKDSHRGFIWVYPNMGQAKLDQSIVGTVIESWGWAQ